MRLPWVSSLSGLKSWSHPWVPVRLLPPREKGPMGTVALLSRDTRRVCLSLSLC